MVLISFLPNAIFAMTTIELLQENKNIQMLQHAIKTDDVGLIATLLQEYDFSTYTNEKNQNIAHFAIVTTMNEYRKYAKPKALINTLSYKSQHLFIEPLKPIYYKNTRIVEKIITHYKEFINKQDNEGNTPLHYALDDNVLTKPHWQLIKLLIHSGASSNITNKEEISFARKLVVYAPDIRHCTDCFKKLDPHQITSTNENLLHSYSFAYLINTAYKKDADYYPFAGFLIRCNVNPLSIEKSSQETALIPTGRHTIQETATLAVRIYKNFIKQERIKNIKDKTYAYT